MFTYFGMIRCPRCNSQPGDLSDYELWAVDASGVLKDEKGNYVTTAEKDENGKYLTTRYTPGKKPSRHISFPALNRTSSNRTWIVITKVLGKAYGKRGFLHLDLKTDASGCRLQYATGGVISGHHGAAGAFSVASKSALKRDSALDPGTGAFLGGPTEHVNYSSSEGPRRMFFAKDGSPQPVILPKPDVTAADGVTTDVPHFAPFFGTSAAAPQVAGIAALMWSKDRSLTAEQIKSALRKSAIQIGRPGWSPLSGCGIVNAVRALRAIEEVKSHAGREACSDPCCRVEQPSASGASMPRQPFASRK